MARKTALEQIGVDLDAEEEARAAQEPEPDPEPPPPAADADVPDERPEWLPEKFKDPAALAESYRSLENELRLRGEREREYEQTLAQYQQLLQQQPQQQPQYQQQTDPLEMLADELDRARENGDTRRELEIQAYLQQQQLAAWQNQQQQFQQQQNIPAANVQAETLAFNADLAMQQRLGADVWTDETKQRVADRIRQDEDLLPDRALGSLQGTIQALDRAYRLVQAEELLQQQEELRQAGIAQPDIDRARKLSAATITGASGRPEPASEADRQLAEMKRAREGSSWAHVRANGISG